LALACDFRIAAENAKLGLVEILLGIIPGGGGTQRLARLIGTCRAKELILSGRQLSASEALEIGLINQVTRKDDLFEKALEMGSGFAKGPLVAQYLAKKAIDEGIDTTLQEGLMLERQAFETVFSTKDAQIGLESFLQNGPGKANFIGQ
jgi:enoyl-CoA hydratase